MTPIRYTPHKFNSWEGEMLALSRDQEKLNMTWLVYPEIERYTDSSWPGQPGAHDIFQHMAGNIRCLLREPPTKFMSQFVAMDPDSLVITQNFPTNYLGVMWRQARRWEAEQMGEPPEMARVIKVDFILRKRA